MIRIPELTYLKRITIVFLGLFTFFILANLLEVVLAGMINGNIYFGTSFKFTDNLMLLERYQGRLYFWLNISSYLLHLVFIVIANRFVKNRHLEKEYPFWMIIIGFLPFVNYFLRFIVWKNLNQEVFLYSGTESTRSNRKIIAAWILTIASETFTIVIPFLMPIFAMYMSVTDLAKTSLLTLLFGKIFQLLICIVYFFYYLEFKRVLKKINPSVTEID